MEDLYNIKFQSNNKFCKICIRYNAIFTMHHLRDLYIFDKVVNKCQIPLKFTHHAMLDWNSDENDQHITM
jgi:hypothetical protein